MMTHHTHTNSHKNNSLTTCLKSLPIYTQLHIQMINEGLKFSTHTANHLLQKTAHVYLHILDDVQ